MNKKSDVVVIIPAYNEEDNIKEVVERCKHHADVCVVNDNSTDRTAEILASISDINVIHHQVNTHIPGGVMDGLEFAYEKGYKYAITLDAGLSHDPDEIPKFLNLGDYDLLIGNRTQKVDTPMKRKLLSFVGNIIYNVSLDFPNRLFSKAYYKDITSGYRRFSRKAMALLLSQEIKSKSYDIHFETTMLIYRNSLRTHQEHTKNSLELIKNSL